MRIGGCLLLGAVVGLITSAAGFGLSDWQTWATFIGVMVGAEMISAGAKP